MAHPLVETAKAKIELLVDEKLANDETHVPFEELLALSEEVGLNLAVVVGLAKTAGLEIGARQVPKTVRGFTSNSHDRWYGKGSCPTHGGSGWEQIAGFAGQKG
jgi:hypothetical protein